MSELLSNLGDRIERVLAKPVDAIGFQGLAGMGRKDQIPKDAEKFAT